VEKLWVQRGVFMGLIMGSQDIMGSDYGSNISVLTIRSINQGYKLFFSFYIPISLEMLQVDSISQEKIIAS
jgi:hypothetical protein